ncbi:hypothetical protein [Streptomyces sp. NBC_01445]|uniref:hypothetical protein n=1 Tax=Streptomyces sp. NBC_01445 TaxID=2903869 RepID=UPI002DD9A56C|nr:hypothetical protein [Streptomyces sp. NBC_01445]WSE02140.1 hypothetical protein OG574_01095 [Streptomyces sp. NBC_01445]
MDNGLSHEGSAFINFRRYVPDPKEHGFRWVDIKQLPFSAESVDDRGLLAELMGAIDLVPSRPFSISGAEDECASIELPSLGTGDLTMDEIVIDSVGSVSESWSPVHQAVEMNEYEELAVLLGSGADPNEICFGMALLAHAIDLEGDSNLQTGYRCILP